MALFLCTLPARGWMFSTAYLGMQDGEGFLGSLSEFWDLQLVGVLMAVSVWRKIRACRGNFLPCGLEAGFGVRSGQSDPWVAVETQMFQKKPRPLHVVSVTPAARASVSRVSCRELSSSTTAPPQPHLLFSEERRAVCTQTKGGRAGDECVS